MNRTSAEAQGFATCDRPLIYVVDDESMLLDFAEMALAQGRWRVKKFQNPELASQNFAAENPKPVLLLTDYSMPPAVMNGLQLAAQCKALHPVLKIILTSGTFRGEDVIPGFPVQVDHFLSKPYNGSELREMVESLLGE